MDPHVAGAHTLPDTVVTSQYSGARSRGNAEGGVGKRRAHTAKLIKPYLHASEQSQPGTPGNLGRFQCLLCQQTFSRVEHLNRHAHKHAKERSLKCNDCQKGFYRMLVLCIFFLSMS